MSFLSDSLGDRAIVHEHLGHHPEIVLTGDTTAVGNWYLHDRVIVAGVDFELGGTAIYRDEYEKVDGAWRIRHTGYVRVYEEQRKHSTGELTAFRNRFSPDPTGSEPVVSPALQSAREERPAAPRPSTSSARPSSLRSWSLSAGHPSPTSTRRVRSTAM